MSVLSLAKKAFQRLHEAPREFKYPGVRAASMATPRSSSASASRPTPGAYPITPSTQMGEYWAEAAAQGHINASGRPLIFIEPEGEHAAAAVTAGLAMTGLRAANFSSGQGIAYMHESLYAAVGKRLTYVLNVGARAMTKSTLNVHAGHDDYHSIDDTGFFQLFAKNVQAAADLNLIAHRIAELALNPGIIAQDGFLTTHLIESMLLPERDLIAEYLGRPDDLIETPTPSQRILYGDMRRRIPMIWDVDNPMAGLVRTRTPTQSWRRSGRSSSITCATHRPRDERVLRPTGRRYARVRSYRPTTPTMIVGQERHCPRPKPSPTISANARLRSGSSTSPCSGRSQATCRELLKGKKGVAVLERTDQPLASDQPLVREIRATVAKCLENGRELAGGRRPVHPELATYERLADAPAIYSGSFGLGSRDLHRLMRSKRSAGAKMFPLDRLRAEGVPLQATCRRWRTPIRHSASWRSGARRTRI
jgi:pyruvate-ferredoxin/flavodoxin oxidoreductase